MVKPRNNRKNKKISNQCDVPINFPANTETDEMEIENKADPNEIFFLVPNSKMLKVNRALQVSGHYKLKLAALDILDDHVSNKDLLSDLSHNQYASAINYQLNLALNLKLIVDPIAFPEKYCWEEVKDSKESVYFYYVEETEKSISLLFDLVYTCDDCRLYHMSRSLKAERLAIVFEGFHKSKRENNKPEISRSSFASYLEMVNKASNDSKLRYSNEWKNIEPDIRINFQSTIASP
ncbi:hypothetical protein DICPUDRAFT_75351 [Dictyostelium purpureum]|uniref:Uncharacterized protein n=1 Tax=Dictyostelium purpureum TaxID=5786 RepID=F0ZAF6_DICPU|nr:uncharacterized protein DICPUDRAFT_75351 [Dictyostelium purpureum]EGC39042.1 hypothetical protein DICPUDRAFT_75351 [Dictyostelium purpureum]|eukprot:XP_003284392.1 hypothetical protein DICPUDRAFT_75351 [Dictyostelium purpureum]